MHPSRLLKFELQIWWREQRWAQVNPIGRKWVLIPLPCGLRASEVLWLTSLLCLGCFVSVLLWLKEDAGHPAAWILTRIKCFNIPSQLYRVAHKESFPHRLKMRYAGVQGTQAYPSSSPNGRTFAKCACLLAKAFPPFLPPTVCEPRVFYAEVTTCFFSSFLWFSGTAPLRWIIGGHCTC